MLRDLPAVVRRVAGARTGDAVFVVGPDQGVIYWDEAAEALTGFLAREVEGRPCHEAVLGEREAGVSFCGPRCPLMRMCREGVPVESYDMRIFTAWAQKRWVSVSTLSVEDEGETYLVHLMRDRQVEREALEFARALVGLGARGGGSSGPRLTERQMQVLRLMSEGRTAREIGARLYISETTVRGHIRSILHTLDARSQLEAVSRAHREGLIS